MNSKYIYVDGMSLESNVSYYESLRNKLYTVIYYLNKCVNNLDSFNSNSTSYYTLNNSCMKSVDVNSLKSELLSKTRYINNVIIPSINNKINSLK